MTESEWLACENAVSLLGQLTRPQPRRKLLLYAVSCCRLNWNLFRLADSRAAVEWAERYADGQATRDDAWERLEWASEGAAFQCESRAQPAPVETWAEGWEDADCRELRRLVGRITPAAPSAERVREMDAAYFANQLLSFDSDDPSEGLLLRHPDLLSAQHVRDIFGDPFRLVAFDKSWHTDTALSLARVMYESRDFTAMPILADALQDAGCASDDILTHCRDPQGVHVRGCWVVDLVLGKA